MSRNDVGVVLMYHRVAAPSRDPFWLCVPPDRFEQQMRVLAEIAEVVPLGSIFDGGGNVAITFDDGYRDNLDAAFPVLRDARLPATVFVSSDVLSTTNVFWWDRLEHLVLDGVPREPFVEVGTGWNRLRFELGGSGCREQVLADVQSEVRRWPAADIEGLLDQVEQQMDGFGANGGYPALLDEVGLRALARDGLIDIGGHTRSHSMLSRVSAAEQWSEISGCKAALERTLERPITTFAYPFGDRQAFARRTVRLVRKAGFELACTTTHGVVTSKTDPLRLPRLAVESWDADEFARVLTGALGCAR